MENSNSLEDIKKELEKSVVVRCYPTNIGKGFAMNISPVQFNKQINSGKGLYYFDSDGLSLISVESSKATIESPIAYFIKPEVADKINKIGKNIAKTLELRKELFRSSVHEFLLGDRDGLTSLNDI